jgi:hypothetical protein
VLGATFGSISAIASIADRIPLPIAVRRPVSRLRIAVLAIDKRERRRLCCL